MRTSTTISPSVSVTSLKVEGLKDDLKNIWQKRASISAEEFAQAVAKLYYTAVQGGVGSNMPMYALRLGWTTGKEAKENEIKYKEYDQNGTATEKSIKWTQPEFMNTAKHFPDAGNSPAARIYH